METVSLLPDGMRKLTADIYRPYCRVFSPDKTVRSFCDTQWADYLEMSGRLGDYVVNYVTRPFAVYKGCRYAQWGQAFYRKECHLECEGVKVEERLAFADILGGLALCTETAWGYVTRRFFPASLVAGLIEEITVVNEGDKALSLDLIWPKEEISSTCLHTVELAEVDGKMLNDLSGDPHRDVEAGGSATWFLVYYPAHGDLLVDCVLEGKKRAALVEECMRSGLTSEAHSAVDTFLSHAMLRGLESVKSDNGQAFFDHVARPGCELARSAWALVSSGDAQALGGALHSLFELYNRGCKDEYLAYAALTLGVHTGDDNLYPIAQDCLAQCRPRSLDGLTTLWECLRLASVWAERQDKTSEATDYASRAVRVEKALMRRWRKTKWGGYYRQGLGLNSKTFAPLSVGLDHSLLGAFDKLYDGIAQLRTTPRAMTTYEEDTLRAVCGLWAEDEERELLPDYCRDRLLGSHAPYACEGLGKDRAQNPYLNLWAVELILKSMWGLVSSAKGLVVCPHSPTGRGMQLHHLHYGGRVLTLIWQHNRLTVQDIMGKTYYDAPVPQGEAVVVPLDIKKRS